MTSELKPCPFCGLEPTVRRLLIEYKAEGEYPSGEYEEGISISCHTCGFEMVDEYRDDVSKTWNTRVTASADTLAGLVTVARLGGLNGVTLVRHLENMRPEYVKKNYKGDLVTRQNAEEVIAAKDARIAELEEHFAEMTRSCLAERDRNKALEADNKRLLDALKETRRVALEYYSGVSRNWLEKADAAIKKSKG